MHENDVSILSKAVGGAMSGASIGVIILFVLLPAIDWGLSVLNWDCGELVQPEKSWAERLYYHSPCAIIFGFGIGGIVGVTAMLVASPTLLGVLLGSFWFRILIGTLIVPAR